MKQWLKDNRGFLIFLIGFAFFRTAIADWNPVPSGSMRPTILEGDVVLVNRLAYDFKVPLTDIALAPLGEPQRGDIVTFSSPKDGTRLIKRIAGLPGDMMLTRAGPLIVPPGEYFMLGDNQGNSEDSRYWGTVPRAQLIGRAERILVSADITAAWQPRFSRWGSRLQ